MLTDVAELILGVMALVAAGLLLLQAWDRREDHRRPRKRTRDS